MSSSVASLENGHLPINFKQPKKNKQWRKCLYTIWEMKYSQDTKRVIHSIKVGIALVFVSLLYLLDPLFKEVGENAMWAIMTVVVVFEFYAGATLSKGINRGIGTILGGTLGCLAAILADDSGYIVKAMIVAVSVFCFGSLATYLRTIPSIKKKYDYGVMIFILTFNLVVVSGLRADTVLQLARQRLSTIGMGFAVCIFISLLIFPIWASDELHNNTSSKFDKLACSIEGCLDEYFGTMGRDKENQGKVNLSGCKSLLYSKSTDESLANFAKWEPWHGKFGIKYPWGKYLEIGEILRELGTLILSLKGCITSSRQPSQESRQSIKDSCELIGLSLAWMLRELGESILKMRKSRTKVLLSPKLKSLKQDLGLLHNIKPQENEDSVAVTSFLFLFMEIVEKVESLANKVEELEKLACFKSKILEV
ncbi:hypothetical protein Leryth_023635 [Lithospermum erythrorhizon]|nr:hypothetical protein Leryth_023635 [Lithospermum erythrorhizon]